MESLAGTGCGAIVARDGGRYGFGGSVGRRWGRWEVGARRRAPLVWHRPGWSGSWRGVAGAGTERRRGGRLGGGGGSEKGVRGASRLGVRQGAGGNEGTIDDDDNESTTAPVDNQPTTNFPQSGAPKQTPLPPAPAAPSAARLHAYVTRPWPSKLQRPNDRRGIQRWSVTGAVRDPTWAFKPARSPAHRHPVRMQCLPSC